MNKRELSKVLSLSCVENYFLSFFNEQYDVRVLYVCSYLNAEKVIKDFLDGKEKYEDFSLIRLQDVSERLGFTKHKVTNNLELENKYLKLIKVNKSFFNKSKVVPWRDDHYIAIEKCKDNYIYYNNYPMEEKEINIEEITQIFDNKELVYKLKNEFNIENYNNYKEKTYSEIIVGKNELSTFNIFDIEKIKGAIMILRVLRRRLSEWINYEGENYSIIIDPVLTELLSEIIKGYDNIFVCIELSIKRKIDNIQIIRAKIENIIDMENKLKKIIKFRRIKNEDYR